MDSLSLVKQLRDLLAITEKERDEWKRRALKAEHSNHCIIEDEKEREEAR